MTTVFDFETTGLANFRLPSNHDCQPRPVQLGAILFDENRNIRAELNLIVKPQGWRIPDEAIAVHGITNEIADRFGLPLVKVLEHLEEFTDRSKVIVSHNYQYDEIVADAAYSLIGESWKHELTPFCTMKAMTPICRLPGPYGHKWPNLQQAHTHCFGTEFQGAHDAMEDVRACARVYFWWLDQQRQEATKAKTNELIERNPQTDAPPVT